MPVKSAGSRTREASSDPVAARAGFPLRPAPDRSEGQASVEPAARPDTAGERAVRRVLGVTPGPVEAGLRMLPSPAVDVARFGPLRTLTRPTGLVTDVTQESVSALSRKHRFPVIG